MGRKKSGNELPEQVTLFDDKNCFKLLLEDTDLDDCLHKINKKLELRGLFDISLVLTRNGKDIQQIRNEDDFNAAKNNSRGFQKFKCRFELSLKHPQTPIQSTSNAATTATTATTAKKHLSTNPSFSLLSSDPTSPITKQGRRIAQPRSAIMSKSTDSHPPIEDYFALFVKETIQEYFSLQSHQNSYQNNLKSISDIPQLSAMRSTIIYNSDDSDDKGKRQVTTPSDVDQLQSSPPKIYSNSQPPTLEGLNEQSDEETQTDQDAFKQFDAGYSSPIEQFDQDHESLPPSQIPPSAQPHPSNQVDDSSEQQEQYENSEKQSNEDEDHPVDKSQQPTETPHKQENSHQEHGMEQDTKQESQTQPQSQPQSQPQPLLQPQQQQQQPQPNSEEVAREEPSEIQLSLPSTQTTKPTFSQSPQSSPFKHPSLPHERQVQDEELDLSKLFGSSTQVPKQPRRSIQAVLGDEKDDEATEKLIDGAKDDDEVMTDYESDDTQDREREKTKLNKSTNANKRGSSEENNDNFDDIYQDEDEGQGEGEVNEDNQREQQQEMTRNAPPVVHSTSNLEPVPAGSPTASERAVSAQVNSSMTANQSFGGDLNMLQGARGGRRSDVSMAQLGTQPEGTFLGDEVHNTNAATRNEMQAERSEAHTEPHPPTHTESPQKSPKKENTKVHEGEREKENVEESPQSHQQSQTQDYTQIQAASDNFVRILAAQTKTLMNTQMNAPMQAPEQSQDTVIPDSQPATQEENRPSLKRTREENTSDEDAEAHEQKTKRQRMETKNNGIQIPSNNRPRHSEGGIIEPPRKIAMPPRLSINFDDLVKKSSKKPQSGGRSSSSFLPLSEIVKDKTRYAIESPMASPRASPALEGRPRPTVQRVRTSDPDEPSSSSSESEKSESSDEEEAKKPRRRSVMPAPDTAPDVYETEEPVPHSSQAVRDDALYNAHSNTQQLSDEDDIRETQQNASNDADAIDAAKLPNAKSTSHFSGSVARLGVIESSGSDGDSDESEQFSTQRWKGINTRDRLHLINAEIADIERGVSGGDQDDDIDGILKQLMEYRTRISSIGNRRAPPLQLRENVPQDREGREHAEETSEEHPKQPEERSKQPKDFSEDTRLLTLDERLRALEKSVGTDTVGVSTDAGDTFPSPLVTTISRLEQQMSLLTQPRHLDAISRRLKLLNTEMEKMHEARRHKDDSDTIPNIKMDDGQGEKIDRLFDSLKRIEPLIPLTPHLLDRLRTLQGVHRRSADVVGEIDDFKARLLSTSSNVKTLSEVTSTLEASLKENDEITKRNIDAVMERMNDIQKRFAKLEAK
ncbi:hypothetical protein E3P98_02331 [Wallemia ichthyophaga]|nr:hypothetical protein E3P98_02331 [Wallemia ichthyophaga]